MEIACEAAHDDLRTSVIYVSKLCPAAKIAQRKRKPVGGQMLPEVEPRTS